ncbi:1311_t:CDS:2, partial [Ambispora leptoticha]
LHQKVQAELRKIFGKLSSSTVTNPKNTSNGINEYEFANNGTYPLDIQPADRLSLFAGVFGDEKRSNTKE